jgi:hypothetical protein
MTSASDSDPEGLPASRPILQLAFARLPAFIALLTTAALAAAVFLEIRNVRAGPPQQRIDTRYEELRQALPDDPELGYVTDNLDEDGGNRRSLRAQYALAPRILVATTDRPYVVADLARPELLPEVCAEHDLEVVAVFSGGVALLRRESEGRQ